MSISGYAFCGFLSITSIEKIEVPADALSASVERYNELVDAGFDEAFGKNVCALDDKPTNGEFIALVADRLGAGKSA